MDEPAGLPVGTVTLLFTDIEGSTRLLQRLGDRYGPVLEEHHRLIRTACAAAGGREFGSEGDALFVVFQSALAAVNGALEAQRALAGHVWPEEGAVRVRMGLHTGEVSVAGGSYVGIDVHRAARIAAAGHGGQVLVSGSTRTLVEASLPPEVELRDLGERRLKDLSRPEHLFQLVAPGLESTFPELRTLDVRRNNLPTQLTSFIGRAHEVARARALLESGRLLTLTGPGGTGKTRLSLQLAAEVADSYPDGVFFVALETINDPDLVPSAIVAALDLQESGSRSPRDRLLDHLRERRALLVLDNFEQVTPAASFVAEILRAAPRTTIIVSSRAALRVSGEQEFPVPSLRLPGPNDHPTAEALSQYEGVALFIERAVAVRPDFTVTNENAPAVAEICARLDGLPLAIELAAARIRLLPPEAILARLGQRLALLSAGSPDLPARQRTLRGAIAWSHDLLDPGVRRLLARAAVFAGGIDLEVAEAVCGPVEEIGLDVLDGLGALVEQSLLQRVDAGADARFLMLQTIREFALEQLASSGEGEEIRRRHATAFLDLAERGAPKLTGPDQRAWLDRLAREHENLRASIGWSIEARSTEAALRLAAALWRFWQMRGFLQEGAARLAAVLALPDAPAHPAARRRALDAAAGIAYWQGDLDRARPLYEESLAIARSSGDRAAEAEALYNLCFVFMVGRANVEHARELAREALAIYEAIDDRTGIARASWALGNGDYFLDDFARAREQLVRSVATWRSLDDRYGLAWALHTLGLCEMNLGDVEAARRAWAESLGIFEAAADVSGIAIGLSNFRVLAIADGDVVRAVRLGAAAAAMVATSGATLANLIEEIEGRANQVPGSIDEAVAAAAWTEGQAMTLDAAVAYALERRVRA